MWGAPLTMKGVDVSPYLEDSRVILTMEPCCLMAREGTDWSLCHAALLGTLPIAAGSSTAHPLAFSSCP